MHAGLLADVQARQVETENARQADKVEQFGIGRIAVTVTDQRVADQGQIVLEILFAQITRGSGIGFHPFEQAGGTPSGLKQAQLHDVEFAAVGFFRKTCRPVLVECGPVFVVFTQAGQEGG